MITNGPINEPQSTPKFQFGLLGFLLFVLVAGPLLAVVMKWYMSSDGRLIVAPTSGTVVHMDGTPAAGMTVSFMNTGPRAFCSTGMTDPTGAFTLSTFEENDGAVPGKYDVTVTDPTGTPVLDAPATVTQGKNVFSFKVP